MISGEFFREHWDELVRQFLTHLSLMGQSLGWGILVSAVLVVAMLRWQILASPVLAVAGVMQTVPSIALLGFLLPWLGIGSKPAIVALVLYALLPLVRNGYVGLTGISPLVLDAARGMGMSWGQILLQVRLPLALPVIFAGIRTAAVINVGVTTLSALVGAGGLGVFIFRGIATNNTPVILLGALPAAVLAVTIDVLLAGVQSSLSSRRKLIWLTVILAIIGILGLAVWELKQHHVPGKMWRGGFTSEFMERPDGFHAFTQAYGLDILPQELDPSLLYDALRDGRIDLACGFSTAGHIPAYHLQVLQDDRHFFPVYTAGLLVRDNTWRAHPELASVLGELSGAIDNKAMQQMNYLVDKEGQDPGVVADDFLEKLARRRGINFDQTEAMTKRAFTGKADLVIGSKGFTEQYILGRLVADWINGTSSLHARLQEGFGGTGICFAALCRGDIDLYPEYSGTALLSLLKIDSTRQRETLRNPVLAETLLQKEMASRYGLRWTTPLGFENTYAVLMREDTARKLHITKISDLTPGP